MYDYNIYFQDPVSKVLTFLETVSADNVLAAQVQAVATYKTNPDWYTLKKQLVVRKANRKEA